MNINDREHLVQKIRTQYTERQRVAPQILALSEELLQ